MLRTYSRTLALATLVALPLAACGDEDGPTRPAAGGEMSIFLTDAPGDVQAAFVTITRVELLGQQANGEAEGEAEAVIVLRDEAWTGDLLELQNDVAVLVDEADVPAGTWRQIRLVISEACIEVEGETESTIFSSDSEFDMCGEVEGELQMPSFGSSGLKIQVPGGGFESSGAEASVLLDFDVSQSFGHQAGNSGRWVLSPVIRAERLSAAATVDVSLAVASALALPTGVSLESFGVSLDGESAVMFDAEGNATFEFVTPGEHTLTVVGPAGLTLTTAPASPHTFTVTAESDTEVALELTGIS